MECIRVLFRLFDNLNLKKFLGRLEALYWKVMRSREEERGSMTESKRAAGERKVG